MGGGGQGSSTGLRPTYNIMHIDTRTKSIYAVCEFNFFVPLTTGLQQFQIL